MKEHKAHDTLPIPEWKGFIHNPLNKANLLNYMGEAWAAQNKSLPAGCTLILDGIFCDPGRTVLLSADCQVEIPELSCEKHEEVDTRMCHILAPQTGCSGCDRHRCDHDVHVLQHTHGWAAGNVGEDDGYLPTCSCHHRSSGGEV